MKSTRNSLKKRVQSFSHDSDDAVIEPLLQKDKDRVEIASIATQSAKYLLSKTKTEEKAKSKDAYKPLNDSKVSQPSHSIDKPEIVAVVSNGVKDQTKPTTTGAQIHNYMNTNVFATHNDVKSSQPTKSQILVEIDGTKPISHTASPLIFTTAKIHTDETSKQMEPMHVTAVPISSTIESNSGGPKQPVSDKDKNLPAQPSKKGLLENYKSPTWEPATTINTITAPSLSDKTYSNKKPGQKCSERDVPKSAVKSYDAKDINKDLSPHLNKQSSNSINTGKDSNESTKPTKGFQSTEKLSSKSQDLQKPKTITLKSNDSATASNDVVNNKTLNKLETNLSTNKIIAKKDEISQKPIVPDVTKAKDQKATISNDIKSIANTSKLDQSKQLQRQKDPETVPKSVSDTAKVKSTNGSIPNADVVTSKLSKSDSHPNKLVELDILNKNVIEDRGKIEPDKEHITVHKPTTSAVTNRSTTKTMNFSSATKPTSLTFISSVKPKTTTTGSAAKTTPTAISSGAKQASTKTSSAAKSASETSGFAVKPVSLTSSVAAKSLPTTKSSAAKSASTTTTATSSTAKPATTTITSTAKTVFTTSSSSAKTTSTAKPGSTTTSSTAKPSSTTSGSSANTTSTTTSSSAKTTSTTTSSATTPVSTTSNSAAKATHVTVTKSPSSSFVKQSASNSVPLSHQVAMTEAAANTSPAVTTTKSTPSTTHLVTSVSETVGTTTSQSKPIIQNSTEQKDGKPPKA